MLKLAIKLKEFWCCIQRLVRLHRFKTPLLNWPQLLSHLFNQIETSGTFKYSEQTCFVTRTDVYSSQLRSVDNIGTNEKRTLTFVINHINQQARKPQMHTSQHQHAIHTVLHPKDTLGLKNSFSKWIHYAKQVEAAKTLKQFSFETWLDKEFHLEAEHL